MFGRGIPVRPKGPLVKFSQVPGVTPGFDQLLNMLKRRTCTANEMSTKKSPRKRQAGRERAKLATVETHTAVNIAGKKVK